MKNNFEIFVCRVPDTRPGGRKVNGEALVKRASLAYGVCEDKIKDAVFLRTPEGKPYFKESDIHFNISHSGQLWTCLVGPSCCGLDVQYIRPCNFEKIAGRFFSKREQTYVKNSGIEGFFEIWTRREAYGKYTGQGFFGQCPELISEGGEPLRKIIISKTKTVWFGEVNMGEDIKCVTCFDAAEEKNIKIREDWDYEDYIFVR